MRTSRRRKCAKMCVIRQDTALARTFSKKCSAADWCLRACQLAFPLSPGITAPTQKITTAVDKQEHAITPVQKVHLLNLAPFDGLEKKEGKIINCAGSKALP
eukprot:1162083-Pelagomonas_calceolata.AAC.18